MLIKGPISASLTPVDDLVPSMKWALWKHKPNAYQSQAGNINKESGLSVREPMV